MPEIPNIYSFNLYSDGPSKSRILRTRELSPDLLIRQIKYKDYIVSRDGKTLSGGYYSIDVYQYSDDKNLANLILGRIESTRHVLSPIIDPYGDLYFYPIGDGFHNVNFRPDLDNQFVADIGAMQYILGDNLQKRHEKGYHFIEKDPGNNIYYGELGDSKERINFDTGY